MVLWPAQKLKKRFMSTLRICLMHGIRYSLPAVQLNSRVQVGEVQSRVGFRSINGTPQWMVAGALCARGTLERKAGKQLRERSSASPLCKPGICGQLKLEGCFQENKQRRRCIRLLSRHDLAAMTWTAASLAHQQRTLHPRHPGPSCSTGLLRTPKRRCGKSVPEVATGTEAIYSHTTPHNPTSGSVRHKAHVRD